MITTIIPKACINEINKVHRRFIWGENENNGKYYVVKWSTITIPKVEGGLGLRNLEIMNEMCFSKLGWKLHNGDEEIW